MPPFLAVFMGKEGAPITMGLFTQEEFQARYKAAKKDTAWAILIDTTDSEVMVRNITELKTDEKTI